MVLIVLKFKLVCQGYKSSTIRPLHSSEVEVELFEAQASLSRNDSGWDYPTGYQLIVWLVGELAIDTLVVVKD